MWTAIVVAAAGCYLLKLLGLSVPRRALEHPRVEAAAARLPVALLAALVATSTLTTGRALVIDARAAVAGFAVALRAPVLAVVAAATATTALVRLVL
jgi:uncharacterized membrane protein